MAFGARFHIFIWFSFDFTSKFIPIFFYFLTLHIWTFLQRKEKKKNSFPSKSCEISFTFTCQTGNTFSINSWMSYNSMYLGWAEWEGRINCVQSDCIDFLLLLPIFFQRNDMSICGKWWYMWRFFFPFHIERVQSFISSLNSNQKLKMHSQFIHTHTQHESKRYRHRQCRKEELPLTLSMSNVS